MSSTIRLTTTADDIARAAEILRDGGTVVFPTETVYGLGADARSAAAVEKIFVAKERPHWDPLIVHVADMAMAREIAVVPEIAERLAEAFWPGPLTMLLPRRDGVPDAVTAGRPLVGVRVPRHPVALALLRAAGIPIAAPSANRFGHTSPTTAAHVLEDLDGRIDAIVAAVLDGDACEVGVESTVVDVSQLPMMDLRPGAVTSAMLAEFGTVSVYEAPKAIAEPAVRANSEFQSLPAPGVGLRHYAPRARLVLVEKTPAEDLRAFWYRFQAVCREQTGIVGMMLPARFRAFPEDANTRAFIWGEWTDTAALASRLFAGLRELDARGATVIVCPVPAADGIGDAVPDRLFKAAIRE